MELICLACLHRMNANPNATYKRQCPNCRAYDLIDFSSIEEMAAEAEELIRTTVFGICPYLDIAAVIFKQHGLKLRGVSALNLANLIYQRIQTRFRNRIQSDISIDMEKNHH